MKASELLIEARALIDTPDKWTKGAYARDGLDIPTEVEAATCFCSMGAVEAVFAKNWDPLMVIVRAAAVNAMREIVRDRTEYRSSNVIDYNDNEDTTHSNILSLFDEAIKLAKKTEV